MPARVPPLLAVAPVTALLMAASVCFYVYLALATVRLAEEEGRRANVFGAIAGQVLIESGASYPPGVWDGGWHRFVLPMFLHANLIHIFINMWSLFSMGPGVERHFGSGNFFIVYVMSGIGGICASQLMGGGLSVGASTSLFGLLGAFLAVQILACWDWRNAWKSADVRRTAFIIAVNFMICAVIPRIDNWGHLGGLVMGVVYGLLFESWRKHRGVGVALVALVFALSAAGVAACRWTVFSPHYQVHLGLRARLADDPAEAERRFARAREWARWRKSEWAAWELWEAAGTAVRAGDLPRAEEYLALAKDVAPDSWLRAMAKANSVRNEEEE